MSIKLKESIGQCPEASLPDVEAKKNEEVCGPKPQVSNDYDPVKIMSDDEKLAKLLCNIDDDGFNKAIRGMYNHVIKEEQIIEVNYSLNCFADEGAYALFQAVKKVTGNYDLTATQQESGDGLPELIDIKLPNNKSIKIPWGRVALPSFDEESYLDMDYNSSTVTLIVTGTIKLKFEPEVKSIIEEAEKILRENSIYKGQAISIDFINEEPNEPSFLDLTTVDKDKILLSSRAEEGLKPVMARIQHTERCLKEGLDLKYGALMEGTYGTGKTLMGFMIGKIATENGWTFIYLKDCHHLAKTLRIADNYSKTTKGCIVFTEDIDQTLRGDRDFHMQEILNTIDGGDTKQKPIISIFTTNHIELIEPTFMRGKRIGGLISLGPLDDETSVQFIEKFVTNEKNECLMADKDEIKKAGKSLVGIVPAFASEIIDKAKAFMISRGGDKIKVVDIEDAANSYKHQMKHAKLKKYSDTENDLAKAMNYIITAAANSKKVGYFKPNE